MKQAELLQRVRDYLDQMKRGLDPLTGQQLPADTILRDEFVCQNLFFAARDLERIVVYDCDWERLPFTPDPKRREAVRAKGETLDLQGMATLLSSVCDVTRSKVMVGPHLARYLEDRGFAQRSEAGRCVLTPAGESIGMAQWQNSRDGSLRFPTVAQQFLLDNLEDLAEFFQRNASQRQQKVKTKVEGEKRWKIQREAQILQALSLGWHPATGEPLPASDPACQKRLRTCFGYGARALERTLEWGHYSAKEPFFLTREGWESISVSDEFCTAWEFANRVNELLSDRTAVEAMTAWRLEGLLLQSGMLEKNAENKMVPTSQGTALGIELRDMIDENTGKSFKHLFYSSEAQRYMRSLLEASIQEARDGEAPAAGGDDRTPLEPSISDAEEGDRREPQAETLLRVTDCLNQLNGYIDPLTGRSLPPATVLRDRKVHSSLMGAFQSLERIADFDSDRDRPAFAPAPDRRERVRAGEREVSVSGMVNLLNQACDIFHTRALSAKILYDYLRDRGYIQIVKNGLTATERGAQAGFRSCVAPQGMNFIYIDPPAQRLLLEQLDDLTEYCGSYPVPERRSATPIKDAGSVASQLQTLQALSQGLHPVTGRSLPPSDPACREGLRTCFDRGARALALAREKGRFSAKRPFTLTGEEWERIPVSDEPCVLSDFLQRVNGQTDPTAVEAMSIDELIKLLSDAGLMIVSPSSGMARKSRAAITPLGEEKGIQLQDGVSKAGIAYKKKVYTAEAQRHMITLLKPFVEREALPDRPLTGEKQNAKGYYPILLHYLVNCQKELEAYLGDDPRAVETLRKLDYGECQAQEYQDPHIQQLYALRYMNAYAYEYREMFRRLLDTQTLPHRLTILSIGCGYGIDYWAIQEAQKDCEWEKWIYVDYTGLDQVAWRWRYGEGYMNALKGKVTYLQEDAVRFLEREPVLGYNVIVFPKSIAEFSDGDFARICRAFSGARFQFTEKSGVVRDHPKVHFLVSLRKEDDVSLIDLGRSEQLIRAMEQNGFVLEDAEAAKLCTLDGDRRIVEYDPSFTLSPLLLEFMGKLNEREISHMPLISAKFFCNRIMTFVRRDPR